MANNLGKYESALLAYAQMRGLSLLRSGALRDPLGITPKQEQDLLSRMVRRGLIAQVRRGLYLVPPRLPVGGVWTPDEATALNALMDDKQARYQITGPNAFQRYGYDEQIPSRVYAYNDQISGERTVGQVALALIKVAPTRLGDTETVRPPAGRTLVYSCRARTLMDAVYDWSRFDTLPRAYDWIRGDLRGARVQGAELVTSTLRYGNQGTTRRIGVILEELGVGRALLRKLERALRSSTSQIPLVPGRPKRGRLITRWGVVRND
ncbi:MAG: type IV toxin-antitoxin system AbiEi family antitoxin domain-containing protein [Candidatus Eisenbacteria sp.]|nr:type IV toxin-antitoxin system AbiEi family antitoxin domain-containing protein [Candidatus Eisenbacteria bacterium]